MTPPTAISPDSRSLAERVDAADAAACHAWLDAAERLEAIHTLSHLTDERRERLLELLSPAAAAEVIDQLPETQAVDAIEGIDASTAAQILGELDSDEQADIIGELDTEEADAILRQMPVDDAAEVRLLSAYEDDVVGGLMRTEYLSYPATTEVRAVLKDLELHAEDYSGYQIQYLYVVDDAGHLCGVVPIRRLLLASRAQEIGELMIRDVIAVQDQQPLEELAAVFEDYDFFGLPVTDRDHRLIGIVERDALDQARIEDADNTYRQAQGIVGGEELRTMPLLLRSRRRLAWLSINIVLNIAAASIIAMHQATLEAVIALAVFLPIISDMSGCSGNQAVAVSMRELTLGVASPRDLWSVLGKELLLGSLNGLVLGLLLAGVAIAWQGNAWLGLVVGGALMLNTIVAVCIGGAIPLVLKGLRLDPALASGPILTTITDMCGFLLVLSLASAALTHLV